MDCGVVERVDEEGVELKPLPPSIMEEEEGGVVVFDEWRVFPKLTLPLRGGGGGGFSPPP